MIKIKFSRYRQCQDCRKVFKINRLSIKHNLIFCPFCISPNTAQIDRQTYDDYYINTILKKSNKEVNKI